MAHEMGHYIACIWYGVDATLPFFLPSPVPVTGTFGAFIRIRSHIPGKRVLFDIGVAGPLAGFVFLVPALFIGLALSRVLPGIQPMRRRASWECRRCSGWRKSWSSLEFAPRTSICIRSRARRGSGCSRRRINLLPAGQLDGGHIIYSLFGRAHKWITWIFIAALLPMGWFYWYGWWLWAVLLFFFARRHPPVYDQNPKSARAESAWALVALVVFLLCFTSRPGKQLSENQRHDRRVQRRTQHRTRRSEPAFGRAR